MMRYAVVIEEAGQGFSAFVPDLPGCIATGKTVESIETTVCDAIRFHIDGLRADGEAVPRLSTRVVYVAPEREGSGAAITVGPFGTFTEWSDPEDDEAYRGL